MAYGAINFSAKDPGKRRRVCITDGRGTLCGGGRTSRAEDDLAKQALGLGDLFSHRLCLDGNRVHLPLSWTMQPP